MKAYAGVRKVNERRIYGHNYWEVPHAMSGEEGRSILSTASTILVGDATSIYFNTRCEIRIEAQRSAVSEWT